MKENYTSFALYRMGYPNSEDSRYFCFMEIDNREEELNSYSNLQLIDRWPMIDIDIANQMIKISTDYTGKQSGLIEKFTEVLEKTSQKP